MKSADIDRVENVRNMQNNEYIIRWQITSLCNYECDFCIQGNKERHVIKSSGESNELKIKICDKIIEYIETKLNGKYECIFIQLIGGEITILPNFLEIINKIINCKFDGEIKLRITTNLSANIEVFKSIPEMLKHKKKRKIIINASYYKEFANENEFIEKIKILKQKDRKVLTKIRYLFFKIKNGEQKTKNLFINKKIQIGIGYPLCNDEDYDKYVEFKKRYRKYVDELKFIIITDYKTCISDELKERILRENKQYKNIRVIFNNGEEFYCSNNNKISLKLDEEISFCPKGYLCDVGAKILLIDNKGNLFHCISAKEKTTYGNILNDEIKPQTEKIICPADKCGCSFYTTIEKIK